MGQQNSRKQEDIVMAVQPEARYCLVPPLAERIGGKQCLPDMS